MLRLDWFGLQVFVPASGQKAQESRQTMVQARIKSPDPYVRPRDRSTIDYPQYDPGEFYDEII